MISECYKMMLKWNRRVKCNTGEVWVYSRMVLFQLECSENSLGESDIWAEIWKVKRRRQCGKVCEEDFRQDYKKWKWKTEKPNVVDQEGMCANRGGGKEAGACRMWWPVVQDVLKVRDIFYVKWHWHILNSSWVHQSM